MKTLSQIKTDLIKQIWPFPGLPASQKQSVDAFFVGGLIDIQKSIRCLQVHNVDVHKFCSTYFECGKTVVGFPNGKIDRVYTIANDDWCDQVPYQSSNYQEILCFSRNLLMFDAPLNVGFPKLPQGFRFAEASTDSVCGRARVGLWAWHNNRLYVTPWIQSNESVVVEWSGAKKSWTDDDMIDDEVWTEDYLECLKAYVEWKYALRFGGDHPNKERSYRDKLADQIWHCNQMIDQQAAVNCEGGLRLPTLAELQDDAAPDPSTLVFAAVGDFGMEGTDDVTTEAVANLIKTWSPEFVLGLGDLFYGTAGANSYDDHLGQFFHDYLFPYVGNYGNDDGKTRNRFWPLVGNHDRDPAVNLGRYHDFFAAVPADRNYYDVVIGPIHLFMMDFGYDSSNSLVTNPPPDSVTADSVQGQWLKAKLKLSTAPFKIVCGHQTPFSSLVSALAPPVGVGDGTLSYAKLQWPFGAWGATLVLNGHAHVYERLLESCGLTYMTVGTGGRTLTVAFRDPPLDISQFRYNAQKGALRGTVTCDLLKLEFINLDGAVIDGIEITR